MHLSTVVQLTHPAEDGGRRAGRHRDRIVTNGHSLLRKEQSDRYDRSQRYDRTIVRWREGETPGNRSDLCKGIRRRSAMNSLWCQFIGVVRIAATLPLHDFEIIPTTSSRVCCGDDVVTLYIYIYIYIY